MFTATEDVTKTSSEEDSLRIVISTEQERLVKLKAEASSRYWSDDKRFLSAILSMDLRSIFCIVTLKDNAKEIYIYNSKTGLYESEGYETLRAKIAYVLGNAYSESHARATIYDITAHTHIKRKNFTAPIHLIPVENGVLDISKNPVELLDFDKKFYFTKKLPVTYDPKAKCPNFLAFLNEILTEDRFRLQIQEMFGWCLRRDYTHQFVFLLIGDGSNGKSKLLGVLCKMLGHQNVTSVSLQRLCENRFVASHLYKKLANILSDMPSKRIVDSSIFKQLTGEDLITAEIKGGAFFEFFNCAKLIFSANAVPYSSDKSFAFYRRWVLIFFNVRFGDGGLPKDIKILEKITTPEELSGILDWAIEGLQRLNKQGDFSERMSVAETREYYDRLVSPISAFLKENITETDADDEVDYIPKDYLFNEILKYCEEKQLLKRDVTKTKIAYIINRSFKFIKSAQKTVGDKPRTHVWENCKFKDGSLLNLDYRMWLESLKK